VKKTWKQVEVREAGHDYFGLVAAVIASGSNLMAVADYRRDGAAGAVSRDPDAGRRWSIECLTWKRKPLDTQGVAEIAGSPRQKAFGWRDPYGEEVNVISSGATNLARLRSRQPVPAFRIQQRVTIDPTQPGVATGTWSSPDRWREPPMLGRRERQMLDRLPQKLTHRQVIEWLMIEIGHGIPYRRLPGRMTGERLLELGYGDCSGKARLLCDLARHRGVPARLVGGLLLKPGLIDKTHVWCEVWLEDQWVPVCPTNHLFGRLPAHWLVLRYGETPTLEKPGSLIFRVRELGRKTSSETGSRGKRSDSAQSRHVRDHLPESSASEVMGGSL
ncbi:MAG TPA: transglutaminase domain-containing protein, partial [Candidatus Ozemobacteraceae bacterium]|nr:transglutaminase domain-containing protein [Candidatus Ozemobacteraceae bacterium]